MFVPPRREIRLTRNQYLGCKIYFVTVCCEERRPIFLDSHRANVGIDALKRISESMRFLVHAYCLMPDHVHFLVEARLPSANLLKFVAQWKQRTGYLFRHELSRRFWQRRFYDHILRRPEDCEAIAWYIWMNPVRQGIVADPTQYPYSGSFAAQWPRSSAATGSWVPPWKAELMTR